MGSEVFGDLDRVVICHELPVSVLVQRHPTPDLNRVAVCSRAVRRMTDKRWHLSRVHLKMQLPGSIAMLGAAVRSAWWNVGISGLDDDQVLDHVSDLRSYFRVDDHLDVAEVRIVRHFEFDRETLSTIERVLVMPTQRDGLDRFPVALDDERASVLSFDPTDQELYAAVMKASSDGSPQPEAGHQTKATATPDPSPVAGGRLSTLVNSGLISAEMSVKVSEEGVPDAGRIVGPKSGLGQRPRHFADSYGPDFWWCSGLDEKWQFEFRSDEVGELNVDSVILDQLKDVVRECGIELRYQWPAQRSQPEDPYRVRLSICGDTVEFVRDPLDATAVVLGKVDELLAKAGAERRLYYRGARRALDDDDLGVLVDLLPVKAASLVQAMKDVHELARPVPCFEVESTPDNAADIAP